MRIGRLRRSPRSAKYRQPYVLHMLICTTPYVAWIRVTAEVAPLGSGAGRPSLLPRKHCARCHASRPAPKVSFRTDSKVKSEDSARAVVCSIADSLPLTLIGQIRTHGLVSSFCINGEIAARYGAAYFGEFFSLYGIRRDSGVDTG